MKISAAIILIALPFFGAVQAASISTLKPGQLMVCVTSVVPVDVRLKNSTWTGTDITFMNKFAKQSGLKFVPVEKKVFKDIWLTPGNGECDLAAAGISITPERKQQIKGKATYSEPYNTVKRSLLTRKGDVVKSIKDLAGKTIIVLKGSTGELDLRTRLKEAGITNTKLVYAESDEKAVKQILQGGTKAPFGYANDDIINAYLAKENPKQLSLQWLHPLMLPDGNGAMAPQTESSGFVVRDASKGLLKSLNEFIKKNKSSYKDDLKSV